MPTNEQPSGKPPSAPHPSGGSQGGVDAPSAPGKTGTTAPGNPKSKNP